MNVGDCFKKLGWEKQGKMRWQLVLKDNGHDYVYVWKERRKRKLGKETRCWLFVPE